MTAGAKPRCDARHIKTTTKNAKITRKAGTAKGIGKQRITPASIASLSPELGESSRSTRDKAGNERQAGGPSERAGYNASIPYSQTDDEHFYADDHTNDDARNIRLEYRVRVLSWGLTRGHNWDKATTGTWLYALKQTHFWLLDEWLFKFAGWGRLAYALQAILTKAPGYTKDALFRCCLADEGFCQHRCELEIIVLTLF
ncbi:uncharacterized protein P174DRAFT_429917 [Aspergillus novofumigatus IBT 16806]|uniref:Uncharacterized protein n=1 Tax=Aspergillus novofumigatus (strain IBT 16806) TaxID=1392255 RepID=A0A2I1CD63_ASPN1|nr:uncharacterized protein P174DRAFT_429917 [Aspergillus novofumigatus IBT 16806]PKX95559.1 hypothetical protein P174DRAFT_429917 [Aspergillus novofumigatus IBT 16806]